MTGRTGNGAFILRPYVEAPSIDYKTTITIFNNGSVSVRVTHDGFPGYGTSVNGQLVYGYDPRTVGADANLLWGSGDTNSGNVPVKRGP